MTAAAILALSRLVAATALLLAAAPADAEVIEVHIDKLKFAPTGVQAHVGDTIEWVNADFVAHTGTARDNSWDVTIPPGKTAKIQVSAAGSVDYFCRFHPNMTGHIVVSEP